MKEALLVCSLLACAIVCNVAFAEEPLTEIVWTGPGGDSDAGGNWSDADNWDADHAPGVGDMAVLPNVTTGTTRTITVDAESTVDMIAMPSDNSDPNKLGASVIVMGANLTVGQLTGSGWWWAGKGHYLDINGFTLTIGEQGIFGNTVEFRGAGTVVKTTSATLSLSNWGGNRFSGDYDVQEGFLAVYYGSISNATVTVHDGATFGGHNFHGGPPGELTLNGMGIDGTEGALKFDHSSLTQTYAMGATLATDSGIKVPGTSVITIQGTLTGPGGMTKLDTGTLILNQACDYQGETIVAAGVLELTGGADAQLVNSHVTVRDGATLKGPAAKFPQGVTVEAGGTWDQGVPPGWYGNGDPNNDGAWSLRDNWGSDGIPGIDIMTALLPAVNGNGNSGNNQRTITCDVETTVDELLMVQDTSDYKNLLRLEANLTTDVIQLPGNWARDGSGIDLNGHTLTFGSCPTFANMVHLYGDGLAIKNTDGVVSLGNFGRGYTGDWQVDAGKLQVVWAWLGDHPDTTMTINGGATVEATLGTFTMSRKLVLDGVGDGNGAIQFLGVAKTFEYPGTVTAQTDCTMSVVEADSALVLDGDMDGAGTLTKTGSGTLRLNGTCTAAGIVVAEGSFGGTGTVSDLTMGEGTTLAPGGSVGTLTASSAALSGALFVPDGDDVPSVLEVEMTDAAPAEEQGWDMFDAGASLTVTATADLPLTINVVSLAADGTPGEAANFDNTKNYRWTIATAGTVAGFDAAAIELDTTAFLNDKGSKDFSLVKAGGEIHIVFGSLLDGDVNDDCVVNILDLIGVRNHLNQDPSTPPENQAYNVNGDDAINILDMIFVRNRLNTKCED